MPNDFDKILRENLDSLLPFIARKLLGLDLSRTETLKDKIQITLEREGDHFKKVLHDDPALDYGLHWEFQSTDEDMRARNLLYYALFYQKYALPLRQIVVYLGTGPSRQIRQHVLEIRGLRLEFQVVHLCEVPKEVFLHSSVPEEVILSILCDFGADRPEQVVRLILQNLMKIIGRVPRLKRYQRQLHVLSRLRKLHPISLKEIQAMPIHYDIETDDLFLAGLEKGLEKGLEQGLEKGLEKGVEKQQYDTVVRMLKTARFSDEEIAGIAGVTLSFVRKVKKELQA